MGDVPALQVHICGFRRIESETISVLVLPPDAVMLVSGVSILPKNVSYHFIFGAPLPIREDIHTTASLLSRPPETQHCCEGHSST